MIIQFINNQVMERFCIHPVHPMLVKIDQWIFEKYGALFITSSWRPYKIHPGDSGIHSEIPIRANDLRSKIFTSPSEVEDCINQNWEYDPQRPELNVCVYHNSGQGWHFHVQVHQNTRVR